MCWSKYDVRLAEEEERRDEEPTLDATPRPEEPTPVAQDEREEELVQV